MADQLNSFMQKFCSLWQAGNDARLNIECHAGQAQIHLQLNIHHQPHPQPPPQPQHQHRRHSGPSCLGRRTRRAQARAKAAKAATPTAEMAGKDDTLSPTHAIKIRLHIKLQLHKLGLSQLNKRMTASLTHMIMKISQL